MVQFDAEKKGNLLEPQLQLHEDPNSGSTDASRRTTRRYNMALLLHYLLCLVFFLHVGLGIGKGPAFSKYYNDSMKKFFRAYPTYTSPVHPCTSTVPPISEKEFGSRQLSLAKALVVLNAEAYIAEPGAQTQFFGNFSNVDWKLSERPLFLIITPGQNPVENTTVAEVSVLTPKFEATRARLLNIPFVKRYIEWAEEEDPYAVAAEALGLFSKDSSLKGKNIFIDNSARHFHYDGFKGALAGIDISVSSAPFQVNQLREHKSNAEIEIMKCASEATLLAIRHVHKQMRLGMRESEARNMMSVALSQIGLSQGGCLTLFGENAALPHGSGTDKALGPTDFALFDCTATLHGYWSDVTRTVALPSSQISSRHLNVWRSVEQAQNWAKLAAREGANARSVDKTARAAFLDDLSGYFTHRLGHGIGLEGHEQPYLNGGSKAVLQHGHAFSIEPGIYIEGEVGVRLEDCAYIGDQGNSIYLTEGAGGPSTSPWEP
ncbi:hypothetical protein D9756_001695 [Leucocoprinus leucothites]|uniref:Peptidase M24 domain-containing protein n=1 Tax=Leucocoprinus leucothites TaxID=201217 RepID=A0A8H5G4V2_9AGAR|nr:hypothetical protein D9756_001695 [Leucoagaricus leucothites]